MKHTLQTTLLLGTLTGLLLLIGFSLGGRGGMTLALMLSIAMNIGSYFFSHKIVLSMHRAKEATGSEYYGIQSMTRDIAMRANIPVPKLYVYEDSAPNAFATGRNYNTGIVAVSTGLLHLMNQDELAGIIAHEVAHIKNRDILISSIAATIGGAISFVGEMTFGLFSMFAPRGDDEDRNPIAGLAMVIIAPIVAMIAQMAISRTREYLADETAAHMLKNSRGLISGLQKLGSWNGRMLAEPAVSPAMASGFSHMYIRNPAAGLGNLFSTHPPIEQRIERLRAIQYT